MYIFFVGAGDRECDMLLRPNSFLEDEEYFSKHHHNATDLHAAFVTTALEVELLMMSYAEHFFNKRCLVPTTGSTISFRNTRCPEAENNGWCLGLHIDTCQHFDESIWHCTTPTTGMCICDVYMYVYISSSSSSSSSSSN